MTDLSLCKMPPQAEEIEQSVLSACLVYPETIDTCIDTLSPDDFYRKSHQTIFKTISDLHGQKKPIDIRSLAVCLKDRDQLEEIGGAYYLSSLVDDIPASVSVKHHTEVIKQKAILREIIKKSQLTIQAAFEAVDATELLDATQQTFLEIANPLFFDFTTMPELMERAVDQIEKCASGKYDIALKTGLIDLDNNMGGGIRGSKLVLIVARPGLGKTALMLNMAGSIAEGFRKRNIGERVGILELEMEREELAIRSLAIESGINTVYLFAGREKVGDSWEPLGSERWNEIHNAAIKLSEYPILIDDTPGLPLQEVVRRVRMLHKKGCKIVFIDQLSKIRGPGSKEYEQKTAIVNRLAELKKELRIPIVLLAQVNRQGELKSTGALEEDSDIIMRLRQTDESLDNYGEIYKASITIEKHRGGPIGTIALQWLPKITAFRSMADSYR